MRDNRKFIAAWVLAGGLAFLAPLRAAPFERDLGRGLFYERIHAVPADLPTGDPLRRHPCVLDVRYTHGNSGEAVALLAWLKFHANPRTPVFLLVNRQTSPALIAPLASPAAVAGLVVLGTAGSGFDPDIAVNANPAAERRAYLALEKGASVDSLITEKIDKPRTDEALLVREHLSDSALEDQDPDPPAEGAEPKTLAPPFDAVLQRAVQLHRALLALKRL